MAKPNYSFEKRQRELAKKRKKEEKAQRKSQPRDGSAEGETGVQADDAPGEAAGPDADAASTASPDGERGTVADNPPRDA